MYSPTKLLVSAAVVTGMLGALALTTSAADAWDGKIVQYGTMHEAIGKQQFQGRVLLNKLVKRPHFFAVAALEELEGEVTIHNGKITITGVDSKGQLKPIEDSGNDRKATMLAGAYVLSWTQQKAATNVNPSDFDQFIADAARLAGINTTKPFVFTIEGEFNQLRLHVINGACPIHARLQKIDLPKAQQPFEIELKKVHGKLVGVFATDSVGKLTHPATSTHKHILFTDKETGKRVTGHVEQVGLLEGAVLRLPK